MQAPTHFFMFVATFRMVAVLVLETCSWMFCLSLASVRRLFLHTTTFTWLQMKHVRWSRRPQSTKDSHNTSIVSFTGYTVSQSSSLLLGTLFHRLTCIYQHLTKIWIAEWCPGGNQLSLCPWRNKKIGPTIRFRETEHQIPAFREYNGVLWKRYGFSEIHDLLFWLLTRSLRWNHASSKRKT